MSYDTDDRAAFRFVEAQCRAEAARAAKAAADAEDVAAERALREAFASLTEDEQRRVNAAYA